MGILENAQHDVFISYAHDDNDTTGESGWVDQFQSQLHILLTQKYGEVVDIWRDREDLDKNQVFDNVIEEAVNGAGLMIALITPGYLKSSYCQKEIEQFYKKAKGEKPGFEVDNYRRLFPIFLYRIDRAEWPEPARGLSGHDFHDGDFPLDTNTPEFRKKLKGLVTEIAKVLELMKEKESKARQGVSDKNGAQPPTSPSTSPTGSKFQIFLANAADSLAAKARDLSSDLADLGIKVISEVPPPWEEDEHATKVVEVAKGVGLTVHLLGNYMGEPISDEKPDTTYPQEQVRIGKLHARSQLILMPREMELELIENPTYRRFIEELQEEKRETGRLEMVQVSKHRMLDVILRKKREIEEAMREACEDMSAVLDLHPNDLPSASSLVNYLENRRIEWRAGTPQDDRKFAQLLESSKVLIVFFGTVEREWVAKRLAAAQQILWEEDLDTRLCVYVAPPSKPADQVRFKKCHVAINDVAFDPNTLDPLLI